MSVEDRIVLLEERHRILDRDIRQLQLRPGASEAEIGRLKREKLAIADEMARLRSSVS